MPVFKGVIGSWVIDSDSAKSHGHARVKGFAVVIEIHARSAMQRTTRTGIYEPSDTAQSIPEIGDKIDIPALYRYTWRRGGPGKKRGFGYSAICWIRSK